jgi:hypothetical protein
MANDIINTYTIYNNSADTTATINYIEIDTNLTEMQHHLYLTGWNPPFNAAPYDDFTGPSTLYQVSRAYVDDISPVTKVYVSSSGTTLRLNNVTDIQAGWTVSGDAYTGGQTVVSTSGTSWVTISGPPNSALAPGDAITFSPDDFILELNSNAQIQIGWIASGVGYSGQTVVGIQPPNSLIMSAPPNTQPSGNITFTSNQDIMIELPPGASTSFSMNYDRVTSTLGTYTSTVKVYATQGASVVKQVDNFMLISAAPVVDPVSPFYDPSFGGGGDAGGGGPGGCSDSGSSGGCDAGGGGSCFTSGTLVTMHDRTTKSIDKIVVGDLVLDAITGEHNKVIGIKSVRVDAGAILFSPDPNTAPFMTEEHPFYDDQGNLCAISSMAEDYAPWLGPIKVVDVVNKINVPTTTGVYNLMFEKGNSHYANGIKVNNIVGTGNTYVFCYKNFLSTEDFYKHMVSPDRRTNSKDQLLFYYNKFKKITDYVLYNDTLLSKLVGHVFAHQLRNRKFYLPIWSMLSKLSRKKR